MNYPAVFAALLRPCSMRRVTLGGLLFLLLHVGGGEGEFFTAKYRCKEELPQGTLVAEIAKEFGTSGERLRYSIIRTVPNNEEMFELDSVTGTLRVGRRLDREVICAQQVSCVIALDIAHNGTGVLSHFAKVEVTADDVNDNPPSFREPILNKTLLESIPPGLILDLSPAVDPDSPANGVSSYILEQPTGPFQLTVEKNQVTNTVSLKLRLTQGLDRERVSHYQLKVKAIDGGQPSRSGTLLINIQVGDVNDNSPQFSRDFYEASVASDAPIGISVAEVSAFDPDEGVNGVVTYTLAKRSSSLYGGIFAVNDSTGEVTTKNRLTGPRMLTSYSLVILAKDLGENSIPTQTNLRIDVRSSNHQTPKIIIDTRPSSNSSWVEVVENNQPLSYVAHVSVLDDDFGPSGDVTCSIDGSGFSLVTLSEKEFKIVASTSFDREEREVYTVTVVCSDRGEPPLTSQGSVSVIVKDEDDCAPRFLQTEYNCSVMESGRRGIFLVRIQAVDQDLGENGFVQYSLGSDADSKLFQIDSITGELLLLEPLDREIIDRYDFHVVAESGKIQTETGSVKPRHKVTCYVHVTVYDADDEFPHFESSTYKFQVLENENSGTEVGRVRATDRDLPPHDVIIYHLEFSPEDHVTATSFAIDPVLGVIYTRQVLDREAASHHTMRVRATPADVTLLDDVTIVFVRVDDVNDNAPVVTFPSAGDDTVHVAGNLTGALSIANISAYDRDIGVNSDLRYSIVSGNAVQSYFLHPRTGSLVWNSGNASATQQSDCIDVLEIAVRDGGLAVSLSTLTRLYVTFDCDDVIVDRRRTSEEDSGDRVTNGFYFVTVTVALVFLILLLVVIVAKAGGRHHPADNLRRVKNERVGTVSSWQQGDVLGPVIGSSADTLSGILIQATGQRGVASSCFQLDEYSRENEANEQKLPVEGNETDDSESGERDTDSGCVDVSSV